MTTHDEQTKTTTPMTADDESLARHESSGAGMESAGMESAPAQSRQPAAAEPSSEPTSERSQMATAPSTADTEPSRARAEASSTDTGQAEDSSLFADDPSGLRSRWDDVQAAFVDDPKECVQKADGLVSEVVEQLTKGFSEARSRLEAQWARGEDASTEDLRLALKRYREFFQRLLSV